MTTNTPLLRGEPESQSAEAALKVNRGILKLEWNQLHIQSRQELCFGACMYEALASKPWDELEEWIQMLIVDSVASRTSRRVELIG